MYLTDEIIIIQMYKLNIRVYIKISNQHFKNSNDLYPIIVYKFAVRITCILKTNSGTALDLLNVYFIKFN